MVGIEAGCNMLKQLIGRCAAFLLLGVITTIVVTWTFAALRAVRTIERNEQGSFVIWDRPWNIVQERQFGMHDVWWYDLHDEIPRTTPPEQVVAEANEEREQRRASGGLMPSGRPVEALESVPMWGTFGRSPLPPDEVMGGDVAFGFPLPAAWMTVTCDVQGNMVLNPRLEGAGLVHGNLSARGNEFVALPYRPIVWGIAFNTLFYGLAWWGFVRLVVVARRSHRFRRGLCPECRYDLRGHRVADSFDAPERPGCPECGWNRAVMPARTDAGRAE
ncbi:MAG: hypothetical protein KJZ68_01050 [Phycisphaerales bacterium]|nr:hypothetical protein [Phycisphaerales bacterium]